MITLAAIAFSFAVCSAVFGIPVLRTYFRAYKHRARADMCRAVNELHQKMLDGEMVAGDALHDHGIDTLTYVIAHNHEMTWTEFATVPVTLTEDGKQRRNRLESELLAADEGTRNLFFEFFRSYQNEFFFARPWLCLTVLGCALAILALRSPAIIWNMLQSTSYAQRSRAFLASPVAWFGLYNFSRELDKAPDCDWLDETNALAL